MAGVGRSGSFSLKVKFCIEWRPEFVGLGRGVGRGVIEKKPEPPMATVLLKIWQIHNFYII